MLWGGEGERRIGKGIAAQTTAVPGTKDARYQADLISGIETFRVPHHLT